MSIPKNKKSKKKNGAECELLPQGGYGMGVSNENRLRFQSSSIQSASVRNGAKNMPMIVTQVFPSGLNHSMVWSPWNVGSWKMIRICVSW